ncbi:TIGR02186 family protein [Aureimonas populi]|uniref:TIGR02186 family protein n=1 Tax=Aureimonas populi TaxID=1701758 RepID=A0ABW5CHA0_9HYPH|nr:TIGR02186 family protein [Aureimonas populi]
MRRRLAALLAALLVALAPARAQEAETFEIGLSTDVISVGTNFAGSQLVVFGALDNADQRILRQGRYDIVVVLEGPRRPLVVRERSRFLGLWINRGAERFSDVPVSYSVSATRPLRDVAPRETLQQLSVGASNLPFNRVESGDIERAEYVAALNRLRAESGLYQSTHGTIQFVSNTLFRANLTLPADLPVGRHVVRAFLFREGAFLRNRSQDLWVRKTGFESRISNYAASNGLAYGLIAVALAFLVGWFGRILFKRD